MTDFFRVISKAPHFGSLWPKGLAMTDHKQYAKIRLRNHSRSGASTFPRCATKTATKENKYGTYEYCSLESPENMYARVGKVKNHSCTAVVTEIT